MIKEINFSFVKYDGAERSAKCILQIPTYVIFDTDLGFLKVQQLISGRYEVQQPDA
jgi:hypothetical protein